MPDASRAIGIGLVVVAVLLALGSGAAWSGNWETVLLFFNGGEWGVTDPTLGRDIGYYVFDLPFWRFLLGWASTMLIVVGLLTVGTYAARALRWQFHLIGAGARAPVDHRRAAACRDRRRLPARHRRAGVLGRRPERPVQAALYTDMNAQAARLRDPHGGGAGRRPACWS